MIYMRHAAREAMESHRTYVQNKIREQTELTATATLVQAHWRSHKARKTEVVAARLACKTKYFVFRFVREDLIVVAVVGDQVNITDTMEIGLNLTSVSIVLDTLLKLDGFWTSTMTLKDATSNLGCWAATGMLSSTTCTICI